MLWEGGPGPGELPLSPPLAPPHGRHLGHHHAGRGLLGRLLLPARQCAPGGLEVPTQGALSQTPPQEGEESHQPQGFPPLRLLQAQTLDDERRLEKGEVRLHPMWLFIDPQPLPRTLRHHSWGGDRREEDETSRLLALAGARLGPLLAGGRQPIAPRLHGAGL